MVSVDKNDNVIGYLSASTDRSANKITSLGVINFGELSIVFSRDFYKFLDNLFTIHNFNKIEWCVVVGNTAEKMYDKIIDKYHGRVVGVNHESTILEDGKYYDVKEYEIFKRDYDKYKNKKEIDKNKI
jgi:hypothetical protein